ncbi:MAG: hypothetical protein RLZZ165_841, partial [Bacteroidota bacterium]
MIGAVQDYVRDWLAGRGLQPVVWRWDAHRPGTDMAASLHSQPVSESGKHALADALRTRFPGVESASWKGGFLNIQFSAAAWRTMARQWADHPEDFISFLRLPSAVGHEFIQWPYRWLLALHEAHVLARLPGWRPPAPDTHGMGGPEILLLRRLLGLPAILDKENDPLRNRIEAMQMLVGMVRHLWRQPILLPTDPG